MRRDLVLLDLGFRLVARFLLRDNLELLDRAGDRAELILAAKARQHHREIAAGEFLHRHAQRAHRTGDGEEGEYAGCDQQQHGADTQRHGFPFGNRQFSGCRCCGFRRTVLGEIDDLIGQRLEFGNDRQRDFARDADGFFVQLRNLHGGVGTTACRCDRLTAHSRDLLGSFRVICRPRLELLDAGAILGGLG